MDRTRLAALVVGVALMAAACGSSPEITEAADESSTPSSSTTSVTDTTAPTVSAAESTTPTTSASGQAEADPTDDAEPAPAADPVALVGGGQFDLGSLEGQDTVLWFWAPW